MVFAFAVLLFQFPLANAATAPKPVIHKPAMLAAAMPNAHRAMGASPEGVPTATLPGSREILSDNIDSGFYMPPPAFRPADEPQSHSKRLWFALIATEHGAAAFDAWSTRRAVSQGHVELDPMMRPFANSGALYGFIQVVPTGLDYLGNRMRRSDGWTRHIWWLPQSLATATYLFSGSYNVVHSH